MWPTSDDGRLDRLVVFATFGGNAIPAGELVFEGRERTMSFFRYAESWLKRDSAYPLLPSLPLRRRAVPSVPYALPLAFYDAAPDGWGRSVLAQAFPSQVWGMGEVLAAAGDDRTGELRFGPRPDAPPEQFVPGTPLIDIPDGSATLGDLMEAAEAVDAGRPRSHHLQLLFRSSADTGGARPKAHIRDGGIDWIAKFPAQDDPFDDPRVEAACLDLAEICGITTPPRDVVRVGGRSALLVRRFDRGPQGRRYGFMSAATLVGQPPAKYATATTYADLAASARRAGIDPCERDLFRRGLFNSIIHNTDDHLRNHGFVRLAGRWELSPVFDLVPCARGRHVMAPARGIDPIPDPRQFFAAHPNFGLTPSAAKEVCDEVMAMLKHLPMLLDQREVTQRDCATLRTLMPFAFNPPPIDLQAVYQPPPRSRPIPSM